MDYEDFFGNILKKLNTRQGRFWMEVGLALILVTVLAIAGASGLFADAKEGEAQNTAGIEQAAPEQNTAADTEGDKGAAADTSDAAGTGETEAGESAEGEPAEEVIADGQYPIMGQSTVSVEQMVSYFNANGQPYPAEELSKGGADSIETFCQMYYDEATAEGVRPEVAFVQTMKETGFLQYGGDASIEQFNFAGLGTTGGGVPGNSYPDVQTGIRAQIQHLKAYATADALTQACVDDRYEYVKKGSAPYVEWLGQQENPEGAGWATADNYGYSIVEMIGKLKAING